ncbi:Channel-forming transporter/cytolysins activator of TpsB family [plant metagenome]|uniref:Channel-forming transporter/cytolysins activator of TpsB family n=1 Tax=plant metagenome TaxID=1297885 RepID=A0A484R2U5_9ZZZZ
MGEVAALQRKTRRTWRLFPLILLVSLAAPALRAQTAPADPGLDIQRRQEQELEAQRARAAERPDVFSAPAQAPAEGVLTLPQESPCFVITDIRWEGQAPPAWATSEADAVLSRCVGALGLQALQQHLMAMMIARGKVTARVLVPEQSLAQGVLTLRYVRGRIAAVRADGAPGWWRMALPAWEDGDVDQRDLDQALENVRRLGGQSDAAIDLVPGAQPGDTDIVLKPGTGKRLHGYAGLDNGGMSSTGDWQMNAGLTVDSPLFLYDQLSASWNSNADRGNSAAGSRAASLHYSIPFGYWTAFAGASRSRYRQTVPGFDAPIVYGGTSKQVEAGLSVVPYRGTDHKGNLSAKLYRKRATSTLDDIEIEVQRRDVVGLELGYSHRQYLGQAVLDAGVSWRASIPRWSDAPGFVLGEENWNGRSRVLLGSAGVFLPFALAGQRWGYQANWQIQHADTAILPADYFTIGNRYAVRGFDGEMTLAGERGWTLRNDLSMNLGDTGHQLYGGVDAGRVGGQAAAYLPSRTLIGAVLGLRGRAAVGPVNANYDLSLGWPLKKPDLLETASTTVAFSLTFDF